MTEFDELMALDRIVGLLSEHGREMTTEQVRRLASRNGKRLNLSLEDALEAIEDDLISRPPRNQRWPESYSDDVD